VLSYKNGYVTISAPARLHMGFLDLQGSLGRTYGGLGLSISEVGTRLGMQVAETFEANGPSAERALQCARRVLEHLGLERKLRIDIRTAIPEHAGLGSGTQLALATVAAIDRLFNLQLGMDGIAALADRGARSGIGLWTFRHGGLVVDGGRGPATGVPPLLSRIAFPEQWRILLILDRDRSGMNGKLEKQTFREIRPMSAEVSGQLCRRLLMQVLPALAEQDFASFSTGVTAIQHLIGDYFAPYQGGRFSSPLVAEVCDWLGRQGVTGLGQSSWGPTGFALLENEISASQILKLSRQHWDDRPRLEFLLCKGRNEGADINMESQPMQVAGA